MNALHTISPYRHDGLWIFDDSARGLVREPFVSGADTWLDLVAEGRERVTLIFSKRRFPSAQHVLTRQRRSNGGHTYLHETFNLAGWLCPALRKYFRFAPKKLYVQVL